MTPAKHQIAIFGATSAIAQATARIWAASGHDLFLCGRDWQKLQAIGADLQLRGAHIHLHQADLNHIENYDQLIEATTQCLPECSMVLIAHGILGDGQACRQDWQAAAQVLQTNLISVCGIGTSFANWFEARGRGCLAVISSVAGDRGRQGNYVYDASKAGLNAFLSGLRNRLHPKGVQVVTIKPGFVKTPMTAHFRQGLLFASPEQVARGIVGAMARGKSEVYLPWFWRPIMLVIRMIPEMIFKRLKL